MSDPRILALIEAHLSNGIGCKCGWKMDTKSRNAAGEFDPRGQHRAHVADMIEEHYVPGRVSSAMNQAASAVPSFEFMLLDQIVAEVAPMQISAWLRDRAERIGRSEKSEPLSRTGNDT